MSNEAAFDALQAQIRRLQDLPGAGERYAPEVAEVLQVGISRQIAAGTDPAGTPWQPTKEGKRPLQHAAGALTCFAAGNVVIAKLTGLEALHHMGAVKGKIRRQILPSAQIPAPITAAISEVVTRRLRQDVTGEGA